MLLYVVVIDIYCHILFFVLSVLVFELRIAKVMTKVWKELTTLRANER